MWRNTDCRAVSGLLWNYTAHRLGEQETERVERHLSLCGSCRAEAVAYRQTVDGLAGARRGTIPESRRSWREIQGRLTDSPLAHGPTIRSRWGIPSLIWAGTTAAAVLCLAVWNRPLEVHNNAGTGIALPKERASSGDLAETDPGMSLTPWDVEDTLVASRAESDSVHNRQHALKSALPGGPSAAPRHISRSPLRWTRAADTRNSVRVIAMGPSRRRFGGTPDYAHMDGRHSANSADRTDYVLTPVSATSDSDSAADYVMGSIVMSGRFGGAVSSSDDTEEARGW